MKTRIEISSLATHHVSGVGNYTRLLATALDTYGRFTTYSSHFNFLNRQPNPDIVLSKPSVAIKYFPLKFYAKLDSYGIHLPFDLFMKPVDLTVFPNFATWNTVRSKLTATTIHDLSFHFFPDSLEKKNLRHLKRVVPRTLKNADIIITVSETVKKDLQNEFGVVANKCIVTTIPPDQKYLPVLEKQTINAAVKKYAIPTERYIYFIGNMEPRKNLKTLIDAYLLLPKEMRDTYSLVLAGPTGWNNNEVQSKINNAKEDGENIIHLGFIDKEDSPALYQAASVFVMPSLYEGFGMPLLEAMASRCPVIASDIPVFHEVAADAAIYFQVTDPQDLSEKIREITSNDALLRQKVALGVSRVESFSWEENVKNLENKANNLLSLTDS